MRNVTLLDNVDASTQQISDFVNLDQRAAWVILITSDNLDGTPQFFIEFNNTSGKCVDPTGDWTIVCNPCDETGEGYFPINDEVITIEKNSFKSNWIRVRVEPNDNTTGNITAVLSYKTFP